MAYYYAIEVQEEKWRHTYGTTNYGEFFDEAAQIINEMLPASIVPAALTELPALENGDINEMTKTVGDKKIRFWMWETKETQE